MTDLWPGDEVEEVISEQPQEPNWKLYRRGGMISRRDESTLTEFGKDMASSRSDRDASFRRDGQGIAESFLACFRALNVPGTIWYLLFTLDRVFAEDEKRSLYFHRAMQENARQVGEAVAGASAPAAQEAADVQHFGYFKPLLRMIPATEGAEDVPSMQLRWRALSVLRVLLSTARAQDFDQGLLLEQQRQCLHAVLSAVAREVHQLPGDLLEEERSTELQHQQGGGGIGGASRRAVLLLRAKALQASLELFQQLVAIAPCRTYFLECRGLELLMQPALLSPRSTMLLDAPVDTQYPRWLTLSRLSTFVRLRLE